MKDSTKQPRGSAKRRAGAGPDSADLPEEISLESEVASSSLQYVKGIGPARAAALVEIGVRSVRDLMLIPPRGYLDRRSVLTLRQIRLLMGSEEGVPDEVTSIVEVRRLQLHEMGRGRKRLVIRVADATGEANLVFFQGAQYFIRSYQPNDLLAISGAPEVFSGTVQWVHPEMERLEREEERMIHSGRIIPQYRETARMKSAGLTSRSLRTLIGTVLETFGEEELTETLSEEIRSAYDLLPLREAVAQSHFPESEESLALARRRMKFEELFFFELGMAMRKEIIRTQEEGISFETKSRLAGKLLENFGFVLTGAQQRVLSEILEAMASPSSMNRLLQGDVGSGKTVVALLAMLVAVENGYQCAFMAPTEILAEQHTLTLKRMLDGLGLEVIQLVGGLKKRARGELLYRLRNNEVNIVVGTHALFQDDVEYANLGLVVIDEQHRFGVDQRARLRNKGRRPDTLIMTATPIPRTLTMTVFGDLDVSVIDELPANRKPVRTAVRFENNIDTVWNFVRSEVGAGRQTFIVYPLVEKSEKLELKSAVEHFEYLSQSVFPDLKLGLLHGQMFWYEKEETMRDFLERKIDIMIATTVIEVGIDIPNASVMVIENAERFGLSQLHQLRGRVGRGNDQSYCILLTKDHFRYQLKRGMSQNEARQERKGAIRRLEAMVETNDGFKISEIDLELRGPGDLVGTRQSGLPEFRYANLITDGPVVVQARTAAFDLIESDPDIRRPENLLIREALATQGRRSLKYVDIG